MSGDWWGTVRVTGECGSGRLRREGQGRGAETPTHRMRTTARCAEKVENAEHAEIEGGMGDPAVGEEGVRGLGV